MPLKLELPTLQSWSCHNCTGCCRGLDVEVTEAERRRLLEQNWSTADGIPSGQPVIVSGGWLSKRHRLARQPDGGCVFLDENGLCRIHSKHGEAAKPLACRLYPFAFHPSGKSVKVSLRFDCPSVAANDGKPVTERKRELRNLAAAVVPGTFVESAPPRIGPRERVESWKDFERFTAALDAGFAETGVPILIRLLRALSWVDLVAQSKLGALTGTRLGEFLELVVQSAHVDVPDDFQADETPGRLGGTQFRLLVAHYARPETLAGDRGWKDRLKNLWAMWRFARGKGLMPPLQDGLKSLPFSAIEGPFGALPAVADAMFTRYFRVKIQGLHFCGPAYYGVPFVEGFRSLALVFPAVLWLARWRAASNDRRELIADDVARALQIVDHHHGYSPAFGSGSFRRRVRMLAGWGDIARLCCRYA
ncbi:MAG: YkgJ family cysteine cluster protein [Planctomycetaceae bacterium]